MAVIIPIHGFNITWYPYSYAPIHQPIAGNRVRRKPCILFKCNCLITSAYSDLELDFKHMNLYGSASIAFTTLLFSTSAKLSRLTLVVISYLRNKPASTLLTAQRNIGVKRAS